MGQNDKLLNKNYILMVQGNAVSALGDILYSVAIGFWVYEASGSSALMGIMSSIAMFVRMFLLPFSGAIIDRCDRKHIIVGMDVIRGVLMLMVGYLAINGSLSIPLVLIAAFLSALCTTFFSPAISTALIDIIPASRMVQGQSIYSSTQMILNLVGNAISGALVAFSGVGWIIIANGVSYLLSALSEAFICLPYSSHEKTKWSIKKVWQDMQKGLTIIINDHDLNFFIPYALIINFLGSGTMALMMPYLLDKGFSITHYGYAMGVMTIASLLGTMILSILKITPKQRYQILSCGFIFSIISFEIAYLCPDHYFVMIMLGLGTLGNALANAIFNASLMLALPQDNRGAVLGLTTSGIIGSSALSSVIYGILGDIFSLQLVFVISNTVTIIPLYLLCVSKITKAFILNH